MPQSVHQILHNTPGQRITALALDGNSLSAACLSLSKDGRPVLHAAALSETARLLHRIERLKHPIFMQEDRLVFPDTSQLAGFIQQMLADERFAHPFLCVFPAELILRRESHGDLSSESTRLGAALRSVLPRMPHTYPRVLAYDRPGDGPFWVWSARLPDLLAMMELFAEAGPTPFLGVVGGDRALREAYRLLPTPASGTKTLVDVGKLQTAYLGGDHNGANFCQTIPVGLARDGAYYYSTFRPTLSFLHEVQQRTGPLLFSPEVTPSPILNPKVATPQVDCTRFAMQVARYAQRLTDTAVAGPTGCHYLSGLASHLPGLRDYLHAKTGLCFLPLEEALVTERSSWAFDADPDVSATDISDNLLAIGAALAAQRRGESRYGTLLRDWSLERRSSPPTVDELPPGPGALVVEGVE